MVLKLADYLNLIKNRGADLSKCMISYGDMKYRIRGVHPISVDVYKWNGDPGGYFLNSDSLVTITRPKSQLQPSLEPIIHITVR